MSVLTAVSWEAWILFSVMLHRLHPDEISVLGPDVDDVVGLSALPSGQAPDIVAGQVLADEYSMRIEAVDLGDLELQLYMHLGEITGQIMNGGLGDPPDKGLEGSADGVSPSWTWLNIRGAYTLYHSFAFHRSFTLREAAFVTVFFVDVAAMMIPL